MVRKLHGETHGRQRGGITGCPLARRRAFSAASSVVLIAFHRRIAVAASAWAGRAASRRAAVGAMPAVGSPAAGDGRPVPTPLSVGAAADPPPPRPPRPPPPPPPP